MKKYGTKVIKTLKMAKYKKIFERERNTYRVGVAVWVQTRLVRRRVRLLSLSCRGERERMRVAGWLSLRWKT